MTDATTTLIVPEIVERDPSFIAEPEKPSGPVPMHPKKSFHEYPRSDNIYKQKQSMNFDMLRTKIFEDRDVKLEPMLWVAHLLTGLLVGLAAFLLSVIEEGATEWRVETLQKLLDQDHDSSSKAYFFYILFAIVCVFLACCLTIYVGPGANGSGIAECMGLFNGINYPGAIGFKTLFVKIFGTVLAVTGGLCIGKEGPLAHIGANIGAIVCFIPMRCFDCLGNDVTKRQLMAAGASAGVSAAFGAPIGGALFSYEISKPNTFWTFSMLWRVFFCTSISTFSLSIYMSLAKNAPFSLNDAATLKFGRLGEIQNSFLDIPAALVIGTLGGLLGAFFIYVSIELGMKRKKHITKNWQKLLEAVFFAAATAFVFFGVVLLRRDQCKDVIPSLEDAQFTFYCPEGQYNPLASLIFNTEGGTIRNLLQFPITLQECDQENPGQDCPSPIQTGNIFIYFAIWYLFTITTYGVWVPAGLFLPGILIGSAVGLLYMQLMLEGFGLNIERIGGQSYIILGQTAMLAGYCRLTYSLAVIMLETTQSINLFLPVLMALMVSLGVAKACNRSLYEYSIRAKQMPLLRNHVPKANKDIRVKQMMEEQSLQQVQVVESVCSVERLEEICQFDFHSIPVVNMRGKCIGLIPKSFIIVLVEQCHWYEHEKDMDEAIEMKYRTSEFRLTGTNATARRIDFPESSEDKGGAQYDYLNEQKSPGVRMSGSTPRLSQSNNQGSVNLASQIDEWGSEHADYQYRAGTLKEFTGEKDVEEAPMTEKLLDWRLFNSDMWSNDRKHSEVADLFRLYPHKKVDLRPYMIEQPYVVFTTDKLPKCLELFRHFHIRGLPVVDPNDGNIVGVLTRQDLFAYMSL